MIADVVKRYAAPVPRYTSYPTAPHFSSRISELQYVDWLSALEPGARLSLYVHIPFCHSLCWYCGCNTKATRRHAPVAHYLRSLDIEIAGVAAIVPPGHRVAHMHWGGGSPNILTPADIRALAGEMRARFNFTSKAEFAVEIDPRHMDEARADAFAEAGVSRVSVGVQDFDPDVQASIGRRQSFEATKAAIDACRRRGVGSINIDLMYGLPHQTRQSLDRTLAQVLRLQPDRIATFGYAHLPQRLVHQRLIPTQALPDALERYAQAGRIARRLKAQGYVRVGLDHFATPADALAQGTVGRNFQGYTTDRADALLGLGASAISSLPQGYVQNATAVDDYARRIRSYGLAAARGIALTPQDRVRAYVIERLMCDLAISIRDVRQRFGAVAEPVLELAKALGEADQDALLQASPDGLVVTERGRPFVRSLCAHFDAYLAASPARYAAGV